MKAAPKTVGTLGLFGIVLLLTGLVFLPSTVIIGIGMVPTLAAALSARQNRAIKAFTIGSMNFAGCMPFLIELWSNGQTVQHAFGLIVNPRTIIVIYCAAGVGYLIDWGVGSIVSLIMIQRLQSRQQAIREEQAKLAERWGREVTGETTIESGSHGHDKARAIGEERR